MDRHGAGLDVQKYLFCGEIFSRRLEENFFTIIIFTGVFCMNRVESIVNYIETGANTFHRVGLELEHFICDEEYKVIPYSEMAECLEEVCANIGGQAFRQNGNIYGIFCMDYNISIEPGCQLSGISGSL